MKSGTKLREIADLFDREVMVMWWSDGEQLVRQFDCLYYSIAVMLDEAGLAELLDREVNSIWARKVGDDGVMTVIELNMN